MKLVAIVGYSDSGKTTLIQSLLPEFKRRGYSVAVFKHCPHGFALDREGTDSWRYLQSGSQGVALLSPQGLAVLQTQGFPVDTAQIAETYFTGLDVVLVEGGKSEPDIPKIWVLREEDTGASEAEREDVIALIAGREISCSKPVFRSVQVRELVGFILSYLMM
jgi:molybdopterin-guanine dinucleotide biosynthesis protein B